MKIKLSKRNWEEMGRKAGWIKISEVQNRPQKWTNGKDEYILLPDGTLEIHTQEISDLIEDKILAKKMWDRKEHTKQTHFCSECGQPDPKINWEDQSIPGMQKPKMVEGTPCCNGTIEDKYGRKI